MNKYIMQRLVDAVVAAKHVGCPVVMSVYPKTEEEYKACQAGMVNGTLVTSPPATVEHHVWDGIVVYKPRM